MKRKILDANEAHRRIISMMNYKVGKTLNEQHINEVDPSPGWEGQNRYKYNPAPIVDPEKVKIKNTAEGKIADRIHSSGEGLGTDNSEFFNGIQSITNIDLYNKVNAALKSLYNSSVENEIKNEFQFNMSYDQKNLEDTVSHLKKIGVPVVLNKVNGAYDKKTFKLGTPSSNTTTQSQQPTQSTNDGENINGGDRIGTIAKTYGSVRDGVITAGGHKGWKWDEYRSMYDVTDDEVRQAEKLSDTINKPKPKLRVAKSEEEILGGKGYLYLGARNSQAIVGIQAQLGLNQDGIFGPQTQKAVKDFQAKNKLKVDGIVGPKTMKALINARKNLSVSQDVKKSLSALDT
jgi:peptidoglycan hydrolase-like protein with peptidoglycan-binding domain